MPQAVAIPIASAAIGAAGAAGGAALQSRGASKASDAQLAATRETLAFEREKEAARQKQWEQGLAAWAAGRRLLAQRYGLNPEDVMPAGSIGVSNASPGTTSPAPMGATIAEILQSKGQTPEDLAGWSEWSRYGLG